ncbi:MAG: prepilin-type N-terminal cleavage/methylation domain-containing protein [Pseudomonadales bacterium]|nr:prepilin-type N-terminal cleavage/methylation domain-containing protein [Pseudomonadales bacterium]
MVDAPGNPPPPTKPVRSRAFTLVELLVVAVVLAIFAGIVVPQFTGSTQEARESALKSTLASVRKGIDLYYQQHGRYPANGNTDGSSAGCTGATTSVTTQEQGFIVQMMTFSNKDGRICTTRSDNLFPFGPYISGSTMPVNPVNGLSSITVISGTNLIIVGDGPASAGWKYNSQLGLIIPNDTNVDSSGTRYDRY